MCKFEVEEKFFKPNKCGSKEGFILSALWYLIPNFVFDSSCNCHDKAYFAGGCKAVNDKARFWADSDFLDEMFNNIESYKKRKNPFKFTIWSLEKIALLYYKAVRKFGHNSFNWFDSPLEYYEHLTKNKITIHNSYKKPLVKD